MKTRKKNSQSFAPRKTREKISQKHLPLSPHKHTLIHYPLFQHPPIHLQKHPQNRRRRFPKVLPNYSRDSRTSKREILIVSKSPFQNSSQNTIPKISNLSFSLFTPSRKSQHRLFFQSQSSSSQIAGNHKHEFSIIHFSHLQFFINSTTHQINLHLCNQQLRKLSPPLQSPNLLFHLSLIHIWRCRRAI